MVTPCVHWISRSSPRASPASRPSADMSLRSKIFAVACGAALALGACGGESASNAAFPAERTGGVRVGSVESADPDAVIGMVLAARLTESGDRVVVLDFA